MPIKKKPVTPEFFNFDEFVIWKISASYNIPDLDSFCPVLLDGEFCSLLEVRSETSRKIVIESNDEKLFLKQIPWYCDDEPRLISSHKFQKDLYRLSAPVARLLETSSGDTWVLINDIKFALFSYVDGVRYFGLPGQIRSAAQSLARVHNYKLHYKDVPSEDLFDLASNHIGLASDIFSESPDYGPIKSVLDELHILLNKAKANARNLGWEELEQIAVHGDYNPWNLVFGPNENVLAMLDFDNCDIGSKLHDVAEGLVTFASIKYRGDSTNFSAEIPNNLNQDKARLFLSAYTSISPFSLNEKLCFPWVVVAIYIELSCLGLIRGDFDIEQFKCIVTWLESVPSIISELVQTDCIIGA